MFPDTQFKSYEGAAEVHIQETKEAMEKDRSGWFIAVNMGIALIYAVLAIAEAVTRIYDKMPERKN